MVEFALIAPILITLVMGICDFGYLFGQQLSLNQAVREGARGAVVLPKTGDPTPAARVVAAGGPLLPGFKESDVTVGNCTALGGVGKDLTATANYSSDLLVPILVPGIPDNFKLTAKAVFRCEY